jgi:CRP-like cAMP-binding protein
MTVGHAPQDATHEDVSARLAEHPFCDGLGHDCIDELAAAASSYALPADAFIFRFGQPATALFLLVDGDVSLEIGDPGREAIVMETLGPGEALGWSWLFPPGRWHLDARCRTDVTLLRIDAAALRGLIQRDPEFGRDLALRVGGLVVDRLEHAHAQIATVSHHDHRA